MKRRYIKGNKNYIGRIIAISMLALVIVYPMGKYFETLLIKFGGQDAQPIITNPIDEEQTQRNGESELVLESKEILLIQNGVFSSAGGAQILGNELQVNEFESVLIEDEIFRVITGVYLNREKSLEVLAIQRDLGYENFLAEYTIPKTVFTFNEQNQENKLITEQILMLFDEVLENTQGFFINGEVKTISVHEANYPGEEKVLLDIVNVINEYNQWSKELTSENKDSYFNQLFKFIKNI